MQQEADSYFGRKRAMVEHALMNMKGLASKVMHVLELEQDTRRAEVEIGVGELAEKIGSDRRDARRALQELADLRVIEVLDEGGGFGHKKLIRLLTTPPSDATPDSQLQGENPPELQGENPTTTGGISSATGGISSLTGGKIPPRSLHLQSAENTTGAGGPQNGGKIPPFNDPFAELKTAMVGKFHELASAESRERAEAERQREREEFLRGKGIYPKSSKRYARIYSLRRLCELWREIDGNKRLKDVRTKAAAFAVVLKEHAPEQPGR